MHIHILVLNVYFNIHLTKILILKPNKNSYERHVFTSR